MFSKESKLPLTLLILVSLRHILMLLKQNRLLFSLGVSCLSLLPEMVCMGRRPVSYRTRNQTISARYAYDPGVDNGGRLIACLILSLSHLLGLFTFNYGKQYLAHWHANHPVRREGARLGFLKRERFSHKSGNLPENRIKMFLALQAPPTPPLAEVTSAYFLGQFVVLSFSPVSPWNRRLNAQGRPMIFCKAGSTGEGGIWKVSSSISISRLRCWLAGSSA